MGEIEVLEYGSQRVVGINIYSKLLQKGIVFINDEFTIDTVSEWQAQLLYLSSIYNANDTINIYINSPGGDVYSCLGLYDVIQRIKAKGIKIKTLNIGMAASAASIILMAGTKGFRECLPNSTVMVHQPSSATWGKVTDMKIDVDESERVKLLLNKIVAENASSELIPFMEHDKYLSAEDAQKYNIIDIIKS